MGYLSCIAYFSHDSYNIADIITSIPSSAYISMQRMLIVALVFGIVVVGMYMAFYSYLKGLKFKQ